MPSPADSEPTIPESVAVGASPRRPRPWWLLAVAAAVLAALAPAGYVVLRNAKIETHSAACRQAFRVKNWQALETAAAAWLFWEKDNPKALLYLAQAQCEAGRFEAALELIDRLPKDDPDTAKACLEKSAILFEALNRPIEGAAALEEAIRLDPRLVEARRRLIYYYAYTLQRRKMVEHAYEALRIGADMPETFVYLVARDWLSFANAYPENSKWLAGSPDEEVFQVARSLYLLRTRSSVEDETPDLKRPDVREEDKVPYHRKLLAELFQKYPKNVELRAYYLDQATDGGNVAEVARLLAEAPPEATDDNRFWRCTGWLHAARGDLQQARTCYEKALELNCYDFVARFQLAGVERRARNLDEVKRLEGLWRRGKELRQEILQIDRVDKAPVGVLQRIAAYAKDCGDDLVVERLETHFRAARAGKLGPQQGPTED